MTYDQAMTPRTVVTAREAKREIVAHGANWAEFLAEVVPCDPGRFPMDGTYLARDVLMWLGW